MHPASHLGPRDDDRASDVVPTTRCHGGRPEEWWTYPVDARQASNSPSKHYLSVKKASPGLCITVIYAILLHLMFVGLYCALKCRSCLKP